MGIYSKYSFSLGFFNSEGHHLQGGRQGFSMLIREQFSTIVPSSTAILATYFLSPTHMCVCYRQPIRHKLLDNTALVISEKYSPAKCAGICRSHSQGV